MTRRLLVFIYPSYFNTYQMLNPYHEYREIDRPHYDEERQTLIDVARERSWYDMDFMGTIECESNRDREAVGDGWDAHWLCQRNKRRNDYMVDDPMFGNRYRQLDRCKEYYDAVLEAWVIHKKLYGYLWKEECKKNFVVKQKYTVQDLIKDNVREKMKTYTKPK